PVGRPGCTGAGEGSVEDLDDVAGLESGRIVIDPDHACEGTDPVRFDPEDAPQLSLDGPAEFGLAPERRVPQMHPAGFVVADPPAGHGAGVAEVAGGAPAVPGCGDRSAGRRGRAVGALPQ